MIGLGVGFLLRRRGLTAGRSAAWPASRGVLTRAGAGCTRPWANDGQCDPHSSINRGLEPGYWTLACSQQVTGPSHMPQLQLLSYDHRTITLPAPLTLTLRYEVLCCYHCTAKPLLTQRNATSRSGWNGRHSDGTAKMAGPWKRNDPLNVSFHRLFFMLSLNVVSTVIVLVSERWLRATVIVVSCRNFVLICLLTAYAIANLGIAAASGSC